jgi:hypothetical protein
MSCHPFASLAAAREYPGGLLRIFQLTTDEQKKEHVAMRSAVYSITKFGDLLIPLTARGKIDLEHLSPGIPIGMTPRYSWG